MTKVLIIEDDKALCHDMASVVAGWGHNVFGAESASEGFRAIEEWYPDVVLCDLNLPDGSGMDIMRFVNSSTADSSGLTFLFISSEPAVRAITDALNLGADDYLIKPIDYDVLRARLNGLLRKQEKHSADVATVSVDTATLKGATFAASFSLGMLVLGLGSISVIFWFKTVLGINLFEDVYLR